MEIVGPRELTVCSGDPFNFVLAHLTEDDLQGHYENIDLTYTVYAPDLNWVGDDNPPYVWEELGGSTGLITDAYFYPIPHGGNKNLFNGGNHAFINPTSSVQTLTYRLETYIKGDIPNIEGWNGKACKSIEYLTVHVLPQNTPNCQQLSECDLLAFTHEFEAEAIKDIVCSGSSLQIELSGADSYSWTATTTNAVQVPTSNSANSDNYTLSHNTKPSDEGSITYTITGHIGDCSFTEEVTIEVMPSEDNFQAFPTDALICANNNITIPLSGAMSYTWTVTTENGVHPFPYVYSGTIDESEATLQQVFRDATGEGGLVTYNIVGYFEDGCPIEQSQSLLILPTPTLTLTQSHQTICPDSDDSFVITIQDYDANYNYTVTPTLPNGISQTNAPVIDANGAITVGFSNTGNSSEIVTYTIVASQTTNFGGNWSEVCSVSETIDIKVIPNPEDKVCDAEEGLIVNEVYHGNGDDVPFIELLVKGNTNCEPVDIRHYILDDDNGDFSGSDVHAHISAGHIRFKDIDRWAAVPGGSIIVIHDMNAYYPFSQIEFLAPGQIPDESGEIESHFNDPTDSDGDGVYILNINDSGLEYHSNIPFAVESSGNWFTSNSYLPPNYKDYAYWSAIDLDEDGDAVQVRNPDGTYFHGLSYGSAAGFNGGPDGLHINNGNDDVLFLENSFYRDVDYFDSGEDWTIGIGNDANNTIFINFLTNYGCDEGPGKQAISEYEELSWNIYPNPSSSSFTIELNVPQDLPTDLRIFDITGKEILTIYEHTTLTKGHYPIKVTNEQLPSGVYICQLKYQDETGQEHRSYLKMVKTQ